MLEIVLLPIFIEIMVFLYKLNISIILLIREAKTLDPFLRKLCGHRSVKFGTVILYKEEECRMLIFFKMMPRITIIIHNLKCWAG